MLCGCTRLQRTSAAAWRQGLPGHSNPAVRLVGSGLQSSSAWGRRHLSAARQSRPATASPGSAARPGRRVAAAAQARPCVLITAQDASEPQMLQALAHEVESRLPGCRAVVLTPAAGATTTPAGPGSSANGSSSSSRDSSGAYTMKRRLRLERLPLPAGGTIALGPDASWTLHGAQPADCILAAADQAAGLLTYLGLRPVMVLVGIARGPALSSDVDGSWAVAAARQAALLGLPAIAACLATPSPTAPWQPAAAAAGRLLQAAAAALTAGGGWPAPAKFPRAHFPFPTQGRWALGRELRLPLGASGREAGLSEPSDCWALGDDAAWQGSGQRAGSDSSRSAPEPSQAWGLLRRAFCEGDVLLCLNVPPTWKGAPAEQSGSSGAASTRKAGSAQPLFAATRPGVLWHCYQVESHAAEGEDEEEEQRHGAAAASVPAAALPRAAAEPAGSRRRSSSSGRGAAAAGPASQRSNLSWSADQADVFGRTLPSQQLGAQRPAAGAFVSQDNTASRVARRSEAATTVRSDDDERNALPPPPSGFTLLPGTLLNDKATAADVEAVFSGRASVATLQTWPAAHPLSLRDELLVAALDEGADGLPSWLEEGGSPQL